MRNGYVQRALEFDGVESPDTTAALLCGMKVNMGMKLVDVFAPSVDMWREPVPPPPFYDLLAICISLLFLCVLSLHAFITHLRKSNLKTKESECSRISFYE